MSESKLTSVLPNNSIKGSMPRNPVSTVYVENSNNMSSLEDIQYVNDVTLGFTSLTYGSQNMFRFSRTYQFLAQVIIELTFKAGSIYKSDYAAYSAIDQIRWTIGGTELLSINGKNLLNLVLEQCETEEKKEELLRAAGRRYFDTLGAFGVAHDQQVPSPALDLTNYAIIPCPWSSLSKMNKIKPFPVHMLSEPIELQVIFKQGAEFEAINNAFDGANLHFRYGKLGNPEMLKNSVYRFPFNSHFSHEFAIPAAGTSVDLNGWRKGEVSQILLHAVPIGITANDDAGVTDKRYFDGVEIKNLRLTFNGQVIWRAPGNEMRIWDLIEGISPAKHNKRRYVITNTGDDVPTEGIGQTRSIVVEGRATRSGDAGIYGLEDGAGNENMGGRFFYYRIPIAEITAECQKQGHFLGADFTKQSIQLTFDPIQARTDITEAGPGNMASRFYVTYSYQAMYQLDGEAALLVY